MSSLQGATVGRRQTEGGEFKRPRRALQIVGSFLVGIALSADFVGLGASGTGFGRYQMLLLTAGGALILPTLLVSDRFFGSFVLKPLLFITSLYVTLALCDFALVALGPGPRRSGFIKGLYAPDDASGYRLAANFSGVEDDGHVRVTYQTNARGHRDEEPKETTARRVLIIGDSYAFGLRLGAEHTIDKQMERLSAGAIDAYNAGVPGYGPPSILSSLKQSDWLAASDVVYFFYLNDLTTRELDIGGRISRGGYVVPRVKPDGTSYSEDELSQAVAQREQRSFRSRIKATLELRNIRDLVSRFRPAALEIPSGNALRAAELTDEMRAVAEAQNARFLVVVIPSLHDLGAGEHHPATRDYISYLRDRNIAALDLLGIVAAEDYYVREGHLNADGAETVAQATLQKIQ